MQKSTKPYLIAIAGPTASGKSRIALSIAQKIDAIVINADAMQVYGELKIINASPNFQSPNFQSPNFQSPNFQSPNFQSPNFQISQPKHLLFGHVKAEENYSVAKWLQQIHQILKQNINTNIIIVGGTGLYFKCFFEGLCYIPEITVDTKNKIKKIIDDNGKDYLFEILQNYRQNPMQNSMQNSMQNPTQNPKYNIQNNDYRRAEKALSILMQTGKPIEYWQKNYPQYSFDEIKNQFETKTIFLNPDRKILYKIINDRIKNMFTDHKVIEEVETLLSMKIPQNATILQTIGVKHIKDFIENKTSLSETILKIQRDNRRYAKRQYAWAKKYMKQWQWFKQDQYDSINLLF